MAVTKTQYNADLAKGILERFGIEPTKANMNSAAKLSPSLDQFRGYVDETEFTVGARRLAEQLSEGTNLKATKAIHVAIGEVDVPRYRIFHTPEKSSITFDPDQVFARALRSRRRGGINPTQTARGGVEVTLGDAERPLRIQKGKWAKATLAAVSRSAKDLKNLEAAGYNVHALRDVLIVKTEDGQQTYFAVRDTRVDREAPEPAIPDPVPPHPGFARPRLPDLTRGLVAISDMCTEVHIIGFREGRPIITIKKPVIYLYPEYLMRVRVRVQVPGEFIAQYPETDNGLWDVMAAPDGTLFDPRTEKKFAYIYWEAENPANLEIDPKKAFTVRASEAQSFLENVCSKFGLNDREKTDFVSYWIASMKRNPINLVQFLSGDECDAYAKMDVEPRPSTEIRMFMLLRRLEKEIRTGNPELPTLKRHRFTVVEWGGACLDE